MTWHDLAWGLSPVTLERWNLPVPFLLSYQICTLIPLNRSKRQDRASRQLPCLGTSRVSISYRLVGSHFAGDPFVPP